MKTQFDFGKLIIKLTSRKLWLAIVGLVALLMKSQGFDDGSIEQIVSLIMAGATILGFIIMEGWKDVAEAKKNPVAPISWDDISDYIWDIIDEFNMKDISDEELIKNKSNEP